MKINGFQQLFATTPLILCGWLGMHSRIYQDSFEVQAGSLQQDATVYAYAPYVRSAHLILGSVNHKVDRKRVLALATQWDSAVQQGALRPLRPVSFEDDCTEGVRGDIFRCKSDIVSYLLDDAERLAEKQSYRKAATEALLAVRLSESLKYGDFDSISYAATEEKRELVFLQSNAVHFEKSSREQVLAEMELVSKRRAQLLATTQLSSAQLYDYMRRTRGQLDASEIRQTAMLGHRIRSEGRNAQTLQMVRKNYLGDGDDATLDYFRSLRLAWRTESDAQRGTGALLTELRWSVPKA